MVAALAVLGALFPFLALYLFAWPQNDDYHFAAATAQLGYRGANALFWNSWTGRFTSTALASAIPLGSNSMLAFRAATAAVLLAALAAASLLVRALAPRETPRRAVALVAGAWAALLLCGMPDVPEGMYWFVGAVTYLLGLALLFVTAASLVRLEAAAGRERVAWATAAALAGVAAAGTNELTAVHTVVLVGAVLVERVVRTRRVDRALAVVLLLVVAASAAEFLAPGERNRMAMTTHPRLLVALGRTAMETGQWILRWLMATPLVPVTVLLVPGFARAPVEGPAPSHRPALLTLVSLLVIAGSFFLPVYGGGVLEPRTVNAVYGLFVALWLWNAYLWTRQLRHRAPERPFRLPAASWLLVAAWSAAAFLVPAGNLRDAWTDLVSGRASAYSAARWDRDRRIRACPDAVCTVPPLVSPPPTLSFFDDAVDATASPSEFWSIYNQRGFAQYYGKQRIERPH